MLVAAIVPVLSAGTMESHYDTYKSNLTKAARTDENSDTKRRTSVLRC